MSFVRFSQFPLRRRATLTTLSGPRPLGTATGPCTRSSSSSSSSLRYFSIDQSRKYSFLGQSRYFLIGHRQNRIHNNNINLSLRYTSSGGNSEGSGNSSKSSNRSGGLAGRAKDLSDLVVPVPVKAAYNPDDINVGQELVGTTIKKQELLKVMNQFFQRQPIKTLARERGLDQKLFNTAFASFRKWCTDQKILPPELHVIFSDILQGHGHVDDLFPYFMSHARQIYPHLDCLEELKKVSDLTLPPNWYPDARTMRRRFVFHSGPTNSGKTYHALKRFLGSRSGIYCGPLKLLAVEVFNKANAHGTPCDLVTGEERRLADPAGVKPAEHIACTVEMSPLSVNFEVAVIDEIQMLRDPQRGWAWTRALLGICADEIHICGEEAALDLIQDILDSTGEELTVERYERLTPLAVEDQALGRLVNIRDGDCVVCFNKAAIYNTSLQLERMGREVAVIYGSLPPSTKLLQADKFNDSDDRTNVLVATDAIGMGLNLSIRRIIFHSVIKPNVNEKGEREMDLLSSSAALQIAGRAGRYSTQYREGGYVTTLRSEDLPILKQLLANPAERVTAAGLHPTAEQMELFAYHLPNATLSNLLDIFVSLCKVDESSYFMCNIEPFKFLADMIQHVPLPLRARYEFCCAPINSKMPLVCTMFLKFTRQYSNNEPITLNWLCNNVGWPPAKPNNLQDLMHLEALFDVFDLYLWLSYRFMDLFPDPDPVRELQTDLDELINQGVSNITKLLRNTDTPALERATRLSEDGTTTTPTRRLRSDSKIGNVHPAHDPDKRPPQWKVNLHDMDMAELTKLVRYGRKLSLSTAVKENMEILERQESEQNKTTTDLNNKDLLPIQRRDGFMYSGAIPTRLKDRLIADGTLTPELMETLERELREDLKRSQSRKDSKKSTTSTDTSSDSPDGKN